MVLIRFSGTNESIQNAGKTREKFYIQHVSIIQTQKKYYELEIKKNRMGEIRL